MKKRFFKPKDKSFRKITLLAKFKEKAQAEQTIDRLKKKGIPAQISEDGDQAESFFVWVWEEAKEQALDCLKYRK